MPTPTTMGMNITEKRERCPTTSVAAPIDQHRLTASTASMSIGLRSRMNATRSSTRVRTNASAVARSLSRKAAVISSLARTGFPVTPTCTPGKPALRAAMVARMPSMASRSSVKLPARLIGSTRMKSRR